jgi:hypothetical protein
MKALGKAERGLDIGDERTEVAVVDATKVRRKFGILQLLFSVHFQEDFKTQLVSRAYECGTLVASEAGGNEQYC